MCSVFIPFLQHIFIRIVTILYLKHLTAQFIFYPDIFRNFSIIPTSSSLEVFLIFTHTSLKLFFFMVSHFSDYFLDIIYCILILYFIFGIFQYFENFAYQKYSVILFSGITSFAIVIMVPIGSLNIITDKHSHLFITFFFMVAYDLEVIISVVSACVALRM